MSSFRSQSVGGDLAGGRALTRDDTRAVFGQTMGLVAVTVAFAAGGAYLGRNLSGGTGLVLFLVAFGALFGLQFAAARGHEQLAIALLFGVGLALGVAVGPVLNSYAQADPSALWQSAGATGLFVGALGTAGYATRRDLSAYYRYFFFALLGLILFGIVMLFVAIPGGNIIYAVLGLLIFGGYTVLDFNRLRRSGMESSVPIAAGIFLDVFNIFLFFLSLFGGGRR